MVCAYSIEDINLAFTTSKLKGYSLSLAGQRPGTVNHPTALKMLKILCNKRKLSRIYENTNCVYREYLPG